MAAPVKPWERPGTNHQSSMSTFDNAMSSAPLPASASTANLGLPSLASPPALPPRPPSSLTQPMFGGYSNYGSSYSPYGGLGSMYSPYGGMGGYGGYGYNRYNLQSGAPGSSTFARVAEENSRPAFQSIESIVQAVSSVSMMLDSSFQAVYSSFRAVIGVADNFSRLRSQLVQIFSALAVIRTLRYLLRRFLELLRLRPSGQAEREWQEAMAAAAGVAASGGAPEPKKSAWPIVMFFSIIMGGPWLIWKLIASFSSPQEDESWMKGECDHVVAQALYDFHGQSEEELSFSAGQQLILAPKDRQPQVRGWLLGCVSGRRGLLPYNYIKVLGKRRGLAPASNTQLTSPSAYPDLPLTQASSTHQASPSPYSNPPLPQGAEAQWNAAESSVPHLSGPGSLADMESVFTDLPEASVTTPQTLTNHSHAADGDKTTEGL